MKKLLVLVIIVTILNGCVSTGGNGDLTGVVGRSPFDDIPTYGMTFIPAGSYNMGPNDQDVPWAMTAETKTVSVAAFFMDETEITNNQYRQFVNWVRDSLAYLLLGQNSTTPEDYQKTQNDYGEDLTNPIINWENTIDYYSDENRPILEEFYLKENERFYRRKEIDTRKLNYKYYWIDLSRPPGNLTLTVKQGVLMILRRINTTVKLLIILKVQIKDNLFKLRTGRRISWKM